MTTRLLYRTITDKAAWTALMSDRMLTGWYHDADCSRPASEREADNAGDDVYTDGGWNTEPKSYPALVHIEADATNGSRIDGIVTTRTTGAELRSEAAIYQAGTGLTTDELVRAYNDYAGACEARGDEPDGFQRWADREGYRK